MLNKKHLVGKRVRVEKHVRGEGIKALKPCKGCKVNMREHASSRCKECTNAHAIVMFNKQRLLNKIEQQNHASKNER